MGRQIIPRHPPPRDAAERRERDRALIEIALFGFLAGTLASALSVVLLIVGLTAATYVATTMITALRVHPAALGPADRAARRLGIAAALLTAAAAIVGLRIGAPGSGGELVPTFAVAIAASAAVGSSTALALLASARGLARLGAGRRRQRDALAAGRHASARRLEAGAQRRREGRDLVDEIADADAALERLKVAFLGLGAARDGLVAKLQALGDAAQTPLGVEIRRARDEIATKLELGERVLVAAEAAAFRLACNEPLRRLARRRPSEATLGLEHLESASGAPSATILARLDPAAAALRAFLHDIAVARRTLDSLAARRPARIPAGSDEDPWMLAATDLAALHGAFTAVLERVEVVQIRHAARATIAEVAEAADAVAKSARSRGEGQTELEALAAEVTRAEAAAIMATPIESDARSLTAALARSTAALAQTDGASLDELLAALRAIA
ncbi:MAG: hypothetical protein ABJE95_13890 [Byssovorax sp.]